MHLCCTVVHCHTIRARFLPSCRVYCVYLNLIMRNDHTTIQSCLESCQSPRGTWVNTKTIRERTWPMQLRPPAAFNFAPDYVLHIGYTFVYWVSYSLHGERISQRAITQLIWESKVPRILTFLSEKTRKIDVWPRIDPGSPSLKGKRWWMIW